jgi:hypothetical protein
VPGNHRVRFHDDQGRPPAGPKRRQPGPEKSISSGQLRPLHRALQNVKLLAKSEHLNLKGAQGCRMESPKQTPLLSDSSSGRFSAPPGILEPRLSSNNLSSGEVGGVLEGKSGYCNRALVDRVSENHRQRPTAAQLASVGCPRLAGISSAATRRDGLSAIPARSDRVQGLASEPGALAVAPAARLSCLLPAALRASCQEPG